MINFPGHVEIQVTDLDRAKRFYEGVFGWNLKPWGDGSYLTQNAKEGPSIGLWKVSRVTPGESPVVYYDTDHLESYIARAKQFGGTVVHDKDNVADMGYYALVKDPDGNLFGLYQDK